PAAVPSPFDGVRRCSTTTSPRPPWSCPATVPRPAHPARSTARIEDEVVVDAAPVGVVPPDEAQSEIVSRAAEPTDSAAGRPGTGCRVAATVNPAKSGCGAPARQSLGTR